MALVLIHTPNLTKTENEVDIERLVYAVIGFCVRSVSIVYN